MGEKFNNELSKIKNMKTYSKVKQRALDDLATAYISNSYNGLDESLIAVKTLKKALRANGYSVQEIEDYLIERSYITKANIRKMYNQSIYNEDLTVKYEVECVPVFHTDKSTTDIIIEELQKRPALLKALEENKSRDTIAHTFKINNTTLLKNFYEANKSIINIELD